MHFVTVVNVACVICLVELNRVFLSQLLSVFAEHDEKPPKAK